MFSERAQQAVEHARTALQDGKDRTQIQNELFGIGGKLAALFPAQSERDAFCNSPYFQEIAGVVNSDQH